MYLTLIVLLTSVLLLYQFVVCYISRQHDARINSTVSATVIYSSTLTACFLSGYGSIN